MELDLRSIVTELNSLAEDYRVGNLQQLRWIIRGRSGNRNGMRWVIPKDSDGYAFHWGGRKELQFNLGIEDNRIRYGVAFSFEPSSSYSVDDLHGFLDPKIERFNDYLGWNPDEYPTMKMWHWANGERSKEFRAGPIRMNLYEPDLFIFLGRISTPDNWNPHGVLKTFDELLPLYEHVEGHSSSSLRRQRRGTVGFSFKPGCTIKSRRTIAKLHPGISNIRLRHNDMQFALYGKLASKYGKDNVGTENPSGNGLPIDVVVKYEDITYSFYEIKTSHVPRICIREAIGQLLEYAFWIGGGPVVKHLVVVGPNPMDDEAEEYLSELKGKFGLPISYDHYPLPD